MIEKPKRPKKIPNQDNKLPQTIQELIRRYDLDNTKVYDFLDDLVGHLKQTQTVVSPTEPTEYNREKVWIQKGKNLYDKSKNVVDVALSTDTGNTLTYAGRSTSDYIEVMPNTTYIISQNGVAATVNLCMYADDKAFVSAKVASTFTTTSDTKYVRFYASTTAMDTTQLEQGPTATEYEAYIEPKIYVLNDNGVYEEFISQNDNLEVYSTKEIRIGTWIDGKPLYRKMVEVTMPTTTNDGLTTNELSHVSSNVKFAFLSEGYFIYSNIAMPLALYMNNTFSNGVRASVSVGTDGICALAVGNSIVAYNGCTGYAIIKYTKSTD